MAKRLLSPNICPMNRPEPVTRYLLVPRSIEAGATGGQVRRFSLARLAPSPRSALGVDRHERLERAAEVRQA